MLKKLQNLLFEEEEEVEEEVETIVERPVKPAPKPKKEPVVEVVEEEPVTEEVPQVEEVPMYEEVKEEVVVQPEPEKKMQRIDLTQPIPTVKEEVEELPVETKKESVFKEPVVEEAPVAKKPVAPKKKRPVQQKQQSAKPAKPGFKTEKELIKERPAYVFNPVISPIFGVDEKDLKALKTTTSKTYKQDNAKKSVNTSPIISPMYGMNEDDSPAYIQDTVSSSNQIEDQRSTQNQVEAEDEVPEFSLDDILRVRDEEFADAAAAAEQELPLFPDFQDTDEIDANPDNTIVMQRTDSGHFDLDEE